MREALLSKLYYKDEYWKESRAQSKHFISLYVKNGNTIAENTIKCVVM